MADKKANATTSELAEVAVDEKKENPIDELKGKRQTK